MKINIPLDSVKKQIREEFRIAPLVTPEMREAEDLWMQIWMGTRRGQTIRIAPSILQRQ